MEIYGDDDDTTDIQDQQEIKVIPLVGYTAQEQEINSGSPDKLVMNGLASGRAEWQCFALATSCFKRFHGNLW